MYRDSNRIPYNKAVKGDVHAAGLVKGVRVITSFSPVFPVDRSNSDFFNQKNTGNVSDPFGLRIITVRLAVQSNEVYPPICRPVFFKLVRVGG
jgi:hypothetical protein